MAEPTSRTIRLYVTSMNGGKSEGLLVYRFDPATGGLQYESAFGEGIENPLFLTSDAAGRFLYVADFIKTFNGEETGAISSYAIRAADGSLKFLSRQSSGGAVPCYVKPDPNGRFVLVANYTGGTATTLGLRDDGGLGEVVAVEQFAPPTDETKKPHPHSIVLDADNRFALSADLGSDRIVSFGVDAATGKLTVANVWDGPQGAGPRHFVFHPNGRFAYVINEYSNTVVAFAYDAASGRLSDLQTLSTLPEGYSEKTYAGDLHIHPNGRWLYGANRGHDSIAIYSIDANSGKLELVGIEPTRGEFPRSFGIDPTGTYVLIANERSNAIVTFRIDPQTGALVPTDRTIDSNTPSCIGFVTHAL